MNGPMTRLFRHVERDCPSARDGVSVADTAMWVGLFAAMISFVMLVLDPSWGRIISLISNGAWMLLAIVAGVGWVRVQKLEAQQAAMARKLSIYEMRPTLKGR